MSDHTEDEQDFNYRLSQELHSSGFERVAELAHKVSKLRDKQIAEMIEQNRQTNEKLDKVIGGFPNQDPVGHRRFHETQIEKEKTSIEFKKDIMKKGVVGASWMGLVWMSQALWEAFKSSVGGEP